VLIDELLSNISIEIRTLYESQEELIDDLKVWPSQLQDRFIFFWIESITSWIHLRWDRTEEIRRELKNKEKKGRRREYKNSSYRLRPLELR